MINPVIAVALSGGIDSLVSGYVLKQQYKHLFGLNFTTGYEKSKTDVHLLEAQLGFPVSSVDLSSQFESRVIRYFTDTYLEGKTPNPCLICNKTIKFGALLDHARKMGADILATGHYATVINSHTRPGHPEKDAFLCRGDDPKKDQSYFLSLLSANQLKHTLFPLANMTKERVRAFAKEHRITPLYPSESQDICFVHDSNVAGFIMEKTNIPPEHGQIIDATGKVVGRHKGLHRYTIGQRRGLNCPASEPYYVKKINMRTNQLEVCFKRDLMQQAFFVKDIVWNYPRTETIGSITVKIRYSHTGAQADLDFNGTDGRVTFHAPQNAVTPGQAAVFYKENRVLGAGIIQ
jgi:tRNA-specific 2-thiouridylase